MRPISRSRNVVRMLAATLVPEHCSSGHRGKSCRWSHFVSFCLANTIVSQTKVCSAIQSVKHSQRCEHDDTTAALTRFLSFFDPTACPSFQPTVEPLLYGSVDSNLGSVVHERRPQPEQPTTQPCNFGALRKLRCACNCRSVCDNDSWHRYETSQR